MRLDLERRPARLPQRPRAVKRTGKEERGLPPGRFRGATVKKIFAIFYRVFGPRRRAGGELCR
jgi:hypothetical protein